MVSKGREVPRSKPDLNSENIPEVRIHVMNQRRIRAHRELPSKAAARYRTGFAMSDPAAHRQHLPSKSNSPKTLGTNAFHRRKTSSPDRRAFQGPPSRLKDYLRRDAVSWPSWLWMRIIATLRPSPKVGSKDLG